MIGENGVPETPDWSCPVRPEKPTAPTLPAGVELGEN